MKYNNKYFINKDVIFFQIKILRKKIINGPLKDLQIKIEIKFFLLLEISTIQSTCKNKDSNNTFKI